MTNPLLIDFYLPPFSKIKPEHVVPAINAILIDCRKVIENVTKEHSIYTWNNLCQPLDEIDDKLKRIFSPISHLNSVKNDPKLRVAYDQVLTMISEYSTWVSHNEKLYKAYHNLYNSENYISLNKAQKKAINNILQNFKLSGVSLSKIKQKRYGKIVERLSKLENQYNNNVLDSTMGWKKLITDKSKLTGIPKSELEKIEVQEGWMLTLEMPVYLSIITYCDNRDIRKEIYYAYNTRASDQGPNAGKWDNSIIMNEILELRQEIAILLGFKNYAYKSLETKMAKNPEQVLNFLTNLTKQVRPQGKTELTNLCSFAKEQYGFEKMQSWDIAWYSEKQREKLFNISKEQIRTYFPEKKVVIGLLEVIRRIYGVISKERYDIDVWHPDVRFFELYDEKNTLLGSFYLDLYSRTNKRSGAWMGDCISQMRKSDGSLQKPVAYLTCNFNRPINNKPALFTHEEVVTLFHEFGHVLHHTLTRVETAGVSGISGIPWDAVEMPSQFMENWCWEPDSIRFISEHYETGESLPKEILNKILKSKNYQAAMFILRQVELSLFDFRLHTEYSLKKQINILEILEEIRNEVACISTPSWNRFPNTFSHIFSDGYAAGYYSYLWSNILAADAYSRFKEEGIFNRTTGQSFLDNILALGGSEEPIELFKRFRGREPCNDALLEYYGIK